MTKTITDGGITITDGPTGEFEIKIDGTTCETDNIVKNA